MWLAARGGPVRVRPSQNVGCRYPLIKRSDPFSRSPIEKVIQSVGLDPRSRSRPTPPPCWQLDAAVISIVNCSRGANVLPKLRILLFVSGKMAFLSPSPSLPAISAIIRLSQVPNRHLANVDSTGEDICARLTFIYLSAYPFVDTLFFARRSPDRDSGEDNGRAINERSDRGASTALRPYREAEPNPSFSFSFCRHLRRLINARRSN